MTAGSAIEYLRTVGRLLRRQLRDRQGGGVPDRGAAVERSGLRVDPRRRLGYLRATGGEGIAAFRDDRAALPPVFTAVWEAALALELLTLPGSPAVRRGVVHLSSELILARPLRGDGVFRCRLELESAEPEPRGVRLHLITRTWNGAGLLGSEDRAVLLVKGKPHLTEPSRPAVEAPAGDGWRELAAWELRPRDARRYARASGDYNPIHLTRLTALPFGFRRPILHGFCLQAMVAHALIEHRLAGRPERLRRLKIGFRAPLLLPGRARLVVAERGAGGRFRVEGAEGRLHAEGEFGGD